MTTIVALNPTPRPGPRSPAGTACACGATAPAAVSSGCPIASSNRAEPGIAPAGEGAAFPRAGVFDPAGNPTAAPYVQFWVANPLLLAHSSRMPKRKDDWTATRATLVD